MSNPFRYFNSSPEVIRLVVMMYVRYPLSLRNVEDLLAERGIDISHEGAVTRTEFGRSQLEVPVLAHAAVAARHVWNASSRRTRSVRREVRWRWTLKVFWTAA